VAEAEADSRTLGDNNVEDADVHKDHRHPEELIEVVALADGAEVEVGAGLAAAAVLPNFGNPQDIGTAGAANIRMAARSGDHNEAAGVVGDRHENHKFRGSGEVRG
jgi:hypothetical protein